MLDLRALGLQPGDVERLTIPVELAPIELGGQRYAAAGDPIGAALEVHRAVDGLHLRMRLRARIAGPCYRCTEPAEIEVEVDERQYHASSPVAGGDDDTVSPHVSGGRLDVDAWAREAIVLSLPTKILCRPGCAGICPHCGQRLTEGAQHDCLLPETDPRWAALERWRG